MSGQIVDASLVAAPRQRNTQAEKDDIKAGRVPEDWKRKPAKLRHKDRDARWTIKFTKAKPREDGTAPGLDLAIPAFGYPTTFRSIAASALSANGWSRMLRPMRDAGCERACSTRVTPRVRDVSC